MLRLSTLCACAALFLTACDATHTTADAGQAGEQEAFSTLRVVLTPGFKAARDTILVMGLDTGTTALAIDSLKAGATYTGQILLGDALDAEIRAEVESHLFTYTPSSDALTVTRTDRESGYAIQNLNGGDYLLGSRFTIVVQPEASGDATLTVRLLHFEGAPKGSDDDESGAQDLTFTLPISIEPLPASGS